VNLAALLFPVGFALGACLQESTFAKRITAFQVERSTKGDWR
jgi:hypothetical protein